MRWFSFFVVCTAVIALALTGCRSWQGSRDGEVIRRGAGQQDISMVSDSNAAMNSAIAQARKTVPVFLAALQHPTPTQTAFTVKMRVTDGVAGEHMWLTALQYDGSRFRGQLVDDPYQVKGYHKGQSVSVAPSEISDWIYYDGNDMKGGYTEKVIEAMERKDG